jgi:hypothetical protein
MTVDEQILLQIFQDAVSIIPDGEDSVFLGTLELTAAPAGVNAVMDYWTKIVDNALLQTGIGDTQKLELLTMRGFTIDEYATLFDIGIKPQDFTRYPIYQSLLITTQKERAGVIYQLNRDSYADYLTLLHRTFRLFNPFMNAFLYEAHT